MSDLKNIQVIEGSFGGGSQHIPYTAPDTLQSVQKIHALIAVSEGEIGSIDTLYLNQVPYNLNDNKDIVTWDYRSGTDDQSIITGFINVESVSESFTSQVTTVSTATVDNDIKLTISAGKQEVRLTFTTNSLYERKSNGDIIGTTVQFQLFRKSYGQSDSLWESAGYINKTGKVSSAYGWDVRVKAPDTIVGDGRWQLKIKRITPNSTNTDIANAVTLANLTEIEYNNSLTSSGKKLVAYPGTALLSIIIKNATYFNGQTPEVLAYGKWIKIPIPSNYNSTTRTYSGNWDGTFKPAGVSTDNVAFIILYCLNSSKCLGIDIADIDKYAFYELAKHCDEQVPNGKGGTIPRYTCNNQFIVKETVQVFLNYLFSLCNANIITNELGQISVMWDRRGQSVTKLVTNANVIEGIFTYASNDMEARTSTVNVTYSNVLNFSKTDTASVTDVAMVNRYGLYTVDVALPGCKYEAQAIRKGYWVLYNNCYLTGTVTFQVAFYGLSFKLGEIIQIQDNYNNASAIGGRIVSYTSGSNGSTTIVFDREITLSAGTYTFTFNLSDGTTIGQEANITVQTGSYSSWTFTDTFIPYVGSIFIATKAKNLYKVIKITKDDNETYTITANQHDEAKYDYIDGIGSYTANAISLTTGSSGNDYGNITPHGLSPVRNLAIVPQYVSSTQTIGTFTYMSMSLANRLKVIWLPPTDVTKTTYYKLNWDKDNGVVTYINRIDTSEFYLENTSDGTYNVRVEAYDSIGNTFSNVASVSYTYGESNLQPPIVNSTIGWIQIWKGMNYTVVDDYIFTNGDCEIILSKSPLTDLVEETLIGYQVEIAISSATIGDSVPNTGVTLTTTPTVISSHFIPYNSNNSKETFKYTYAMNLIDSQKYVDRAQRNFLVIAHSVNSLNKLSQGFTVTFTNPVPGKPDLTVQTNGTSVHFTVTPTGTSEIRGCIIYRGTAPNFPKDASTVIYNGTSLTPSIIAPDNQTYYYAAACYDDFGV